MSFSENLRAELYYRNITIKELAYKTDIPYSTMLTYVNKSGSKPNIEIGLKIAKALDVTVEYLVTGEDPKTCSFSSQELLTKTTKAYDALKKINSLLREVMKILVMIQQ